MNNEKRAEHAGDALDFFAAGWCDEEDTLADLLCDLMHLANQRCGDQWPTFEQELARARANYEAELVEETRPPPAVCQSAARTSSTSRRCSTTCSPSMVGYHAFQRPTGRPFQPQLHSGVTSAPIPSPLVTRLIVLCSVI